MQLVRYASAAFLFLLGTFASASWSPLTVGGTGSRSITTYNGAIYVATYPSGVRKSTNGGASWSLVNTGLPTTSGNVNAQSVGHSATALFCGTESGIYRSTNEGASWELANGPLPFSTSIYANKFYTFGNVTFAVFSEMVSQNAGGVFRTTDNGTTWLQGFSGLSGNMTVYNLDDDGASLYAATSTSLMKSVDLGQSWTQAGTSNFGVFAVQAVAGRLVALSALGARWSTNGGTSWTTSVNYPVTPPPGSELIAYDGKYYAITKVGNNGVYRSLNGGVNWEPFNDGLQPADVFSQQEFHASGNTLYIACLFDSYSTPGTTTAVYEQGSEVLPAPYPTAFTDHFTVDLSSVEAGNTILLFDASGKEVMRLGNVPASPFKVERGTLITGLYYCVLLDPSTGGMRSFGSVIAQ